MNNDLFISYCRRDEDVVKALTRGLEAAGVDVWRDHELHGGDNWWSVILEKIRRCSVFIFALSEMSLHQSKPCRAELEYARALGRPIVPVQVGPVPNLRVMPIADLQVVGYNPDDATSGFTVLAAVHQAACRTPALPDPLPAPPPIPYGYLLALSSKIDVGDLNSAEQMRIIDDLRRALAEESEEAVRADIVRMLTQLRSKPWTVVAADKEIEQILGSQGVTSFISRPVDGTPSRRSPADSNAKRSTQESRDAPPPGWYPDPSTRHEWRWFDRGWTSWASDRGVVVEDPI